VLYFAAVAPNLTGWVRIETILFLRSLSDIFLASVSASLLTALAFLAVLDHKPKGAIHFCDRRMFAWGILPKY
jgi:hypothetical protein